MIPIDSVLNRRSVRITDDAYQIIQRIAIALHPADLGKIVLMQIVNDHIAMYKAICKHRDQQWDDRCVDDDKELYAVIREPIPDLATPPDDQMAESCARWRAQRGCPVAELPPGKLTIRQLEERVAELETALMSGWLFYDETPCCGMGTRHALKRAKIGAPIWFMYFQDAWMRVSHCPFCGRKLPTESPA
jgi:hypothetical protein